MVANAAVSSSRTTPPIWCVGFWKHLHQTTIRIPIELAECLKVARGSYRNIRETLSDADFSKPRQVSSEKIRVQADAVAGGITVHLDGSPLARVASALEVDGVAQAGKHARGAWSLDVAIGVVQVARTAGGRVAILRHMV